MMELKEGAKLVIVTPYIHPRAYKDEIEKAIKELLDMGFMRLSISPFASSIVLMKDGTMQMCIDYRLLNNNTIKNRYSILRVDGLHEANYFSKIDLKSRYHHIQMKEGDIYKIILCFYFVHFEFMMMPFGLTNASTTFQSTINQVFWEQLRKCILIFFDDILIYNRTWKEHLEDMLKILQEK